MDNIPVRWMIVMVLCNLTHTLMTKSCVNYIKDGYHKVALQGRWPPKTVIVYSRFYYIVAIHVNCGQFSKFISQFFLGKML